LRRGGQGGWSRHDQLRDLRRGGSGGWSRRNQGLVRGSGAAGPRGNAAAAEGAGYPDQYLVEGWASYDVNARFPTFDQGAGFAGSTPPVPPFPRGEGFEIGLSIAKKSPLSQPSPPRHSPPLKQGGKGGLPHPAGVEGGFGGVDRLVAHRGSLRWVAQSGIKWQHFRGVLITDLQCQKRFRPDPETGWYSRRRRWRGRSARASLSGAWPTADRCAGWH